MRGDGAVPPATLYALLTREAGLRARDLLRGRGGSSWSIIIGTRLIRSRIPGTSSTSFDGKSLSSERRTPLRVSDAA